MRSLPMLLMTVLMGYSAQKMTSKFDHLKISIAQIQLKSIGRFIKINSIDGTFPKNIRDSDFSDYLKQNMDGSKASAHLDPWGRPYTAVYVKQKLILISRGPDGKLNNFDDLRETVKF